MRSGFVGYFSAKVKKSKPFFWGSLGFFTENSQTTKAESFGGKRSNIRVFFYFFCNKFDFIKKRYKM